MALNLNSDLIKKSSLFATGFLSGITASYLYCKYVCCKKKSSTSKCTGDFCKIEISTEPNVELN